MQIRLAELLAAISLATDLGRGFPQEKALRIKVERPTAKRTLRPAVSKGKAKGKGKRATKPATKGRKKS